MSRFSILFIVVIVLTACVPQIFEPTATPTATITPPPTKTPAPTFTPSPTASATPTPKYSPEQLSNLKDWQSFFKGILQINDDEQIQTLDGNIIKGMVYNAKTNTIAYTFFSDYAEQEIMQPLVKSDFTFTTGENWKVLAWEYDSKTSQLVRQNYVTTFGKKTKVPLLALEEIKQEIINNHSKEPNENIDSAEHIKELIRPYNGGLIGNAYSSFKYQDLYEYRFGFNWGDNYVLLWNKDTNQYNKTSTAFYAVAGLGPPPLNKAIGRDYAAVVWVGSDGNRIVRVITGKSIDMYKTWGYDENNLP
jgi:hypothetical protein